MTRRPWTAREAALEIISKLRAEGNVALLAGGCVRDMLLHLEPKDYDVATDASPQRVLVLFPNSREVGVKFGVVIVRMKGFDVEVSTFRTDGTYDDGRRPSSVAFADAETDAQRRDFTINGLFFDPGEGKVLDFVGGQEDLRAGILRTIGDPERRFEEDHLRMLRAVRFTARLGFDLDAATLEAIRKHAARLTGISAERVSQELQWMLAVPSRTKAWQLLIESELRKYLCSTWTVEPEEDRFAGCVLSHLPDSTIEAPLVFAALWTKRTEDNLSEMARGLRLSNSVYDAVRWLVLSLRELDSRQVGALEPADLKLLMMEPTWIHLPVLYRAYLLASGRTLSPWNELCRRAEAFTPDEIAPPPLITGADLTQLGRPPGPEYGIILAEAYRAQLNGELTDREQALTWLRNRIG